MLQVHFFPHSRQTSGSLASWVVPVVEMSMFVVPVMMVPVMVPVPAPGEDT